MKYEWIDEKWKTYMTLLPFDLLCKADEKLIFDFGPDRDIFRLDRILPLVGALGT